MDWLTDTPCLKKSAGFFIAKDGPDKPQQMMYWLKNRVGPITTIGKEEVMRTYLLLILLFCLSVVSPSFASSSITKFQVVAQDKTVLSILVSKNTTAEQLKMLISEFRNARKNNTLSKMIPATTKGGQFGDYCIVWIFVFSEPEWATDDKLQKFIKSSLNSTTDKQFDKEYVKHIKAEYFYSPSEEYGNFGYDDGMVRSSNYKKIF